MDRTENQDSPATPVQVRNAQKANKLRTKTGRTGGGFILLMWGYVTSSDYALQSGSRKSHRLQEDLVQCHWERGTF